MRLAGITGIGEAMTVFIAGAVSFVVLEETMEEFESGTIDKVEDGAGVKDSDTKELSVSVFRMEVYDVVVTVESDN